MRRKILLVFGTRPEAIKMSPIIAAMSLRAELFDIRICTTAQHREMLDDTLSLFDIRTDYDLNLMQEDQSLSDLTARIFSALEPIFCKENPDWMLVQGDTTTAMTASLAGYYHQCRIGHIEAGLRTGDKFQPFPEEINRRITDVVADLHFAPTETARENLLSEGIGKESIFVTGNTVIDALMQAVQVEYDFNNGPLAKIALDKRIVLVTVHRRENFGGQIRSICEALMVISKCYVNDVHIVCPVHLNPNIRAPVQSLLTGISNITLLEPLDYLSFVHLMNRSYIVLTDSGGLQEEAPSLGKPVLVLRDVTERPEAVEAGTARLVGTDTERIVQETVRLLDNPAYYAEMANAVNPYGDGHAAERICEQLLTACNVKVTYVC